MPRLLVIDDEPNVQYSLVKSLGSDVTQVLTAGTAREGIEVVRQHAPDAVILDVRLPDMSGLDAYDQIRLIDPRLPVIIVTAYGTTETAIEAMKRGAFEYLLKPVDLHQLRDVIDKAVELSHLSRVPAVFDEPHEAELRESDADADRIVGRSLVMQEIYKAVGRVAPRDVTVLIRGESGTGKELVARAVYQHSARSQRPFVTINCAAIPEALLESELFGHERGAFTGADRRRIGKFEQASGGTMLMDEVGDMSYATQAKLLRVLQEQRFERLGGNETIYSDVRLIAATNQDLEGMVAQGEFRSDLFYRLNVFSIQLPPLRERMEDLPQLVEHFIRRVGRLMGKSAVSLSPDTLHILQQYQWPGNIREVQSAIKFALVHASGEVITPDCLPETVRNPTEPRSSGSTSEELEVSTRVRQLLARGGGAVYQDVHSAVDRILFDEVLRHVKGNQVEAARVLGISRNTLRAKLRLLGLAVEKQLHDSERGDQ